MKHLSTILSALALIGVIILFILRSSPTSKNVSHTKIIKDTSGNETIVNEGKIAYVDIDSLEANYDYFKKKKAEFEQRQKNIDADLEKMANALQNEYIRLQTKAQKGELSEDEGRKAEQSLMQKQQELELKRQNLGSKYLKDQEAFNKEIHDNLNTIIEEYNTDKGYDYILSYSKDGSILFANKNLDITDDIINKMNEKKSNSK
ncbi:MAG TPA: OmpH family outer membrane protein [Chitinophagaceae bacterium]|nr:MAG: outer membrane chaperone Skp [Bacteroidetes bacterium OLB11]HMN32530.1 OmpH family outer membrane protein [Chitinophagaceae bacterium]